jgi:hypothetical protein
VLSLPQSSSPPFPLRIAAVAAVAAVIAVIDRPAACCAAAPGRGVDDEARGAGYGAGSGSSDAFELFKLTRENIALRAQVETLRECLGLFGRRRSEHRGGGGGY